MDVRSGSLGDAGSGSGEHRLLGWGAMFCGCFGSDAGSKKWARRGTWAAIFPAIGFAVRYGLDGILSDGVTDAVLATSLAAAVAFIYWTTWRYVQDLDEMHQRIMLEAFAFSFFGTMTVVVGLGIYGLAARTAFDLIWIYALAEGLRGLGLVVAARKYR